MYGRLQSILILLRKMFIFCGNQVDSFFRLLSKNDKNYDASRFAMDLSHRLKYFFLHRDKIYVNKFTSTVHYTQKH